MDRAEYFSMQGRVYIGPRNPNGSREPARWVFDSSLLETAQSVDREEKQESWSGQRTVAATMNTKKGMTGNLTLGQLCTDNAALALDGERVEVVSGSVAGEAIGDVVAGDVWPLDYAAVSDLQMETGAAVALVEDTDYTVDETLGVITFLATKAGVTADYDYAAQSLVTAFTSQNQDYYILFAGLNTVDGTSTKCRGELYNLTMNPAENFGYIQASFGDLALSFIAKMDPVRQIDPKFGPFGRLILIQED